MEDYVAWCRYVNTPNGDTCIRLCDSDADGAFRVYRHSENPGGVDVAYLYRYPDGTTQIRAPGIEDGEVVTDMLKEGLRAMSEGTKIHVV